DPGPAEPLDRDPYWLRVLALPESRSHQRECSLEVAVHGVRGSSAKVIAQRTDRLPTPRAQQMAHRFVYCALRTERSQGAAFRTQGRDQAVEAHPGASFPYFVLRPELADKLGGPCADLLGDGRDLEAPADHLGRRLPVLPLDGFTHAIEEGVNRL